jgi:hypothetical protein
MPSRYLGEKSKINYGVYIPKVSWLLLRLFAERIFSRPPIGNADRGKSAEVNTIDQVETGAVASPRH